MSHGTVKSTGGAGIWVFTPAGIWVFFYTACTRALAGGARSYRHVAAILKHGLDRLSAATEDRAEQPSLLHDHLRGPHYYR